MLIKTTLLLACVGHILCGVSDCFLSYTPKGRLNLKEISDSQKMNRMFADMPLNYPMLSMLLGVFALCVAVFGYLGLSNWISQYSTVYAAIMYISSLLYFILIVTHHVFFGTVEWFYIRLGRSDEARDAVLEFQKKTIITMYAGYAALLVFALTLFIAVITGNTALPRWACVFNVLPLFLAILPTKLPAKGNIASAIMFLGLLFLI